MNLDEKIEKLKTITEKLEKGKFSFEECVKMYEEGAALTIECYKLLNDVKGKFSVIKKDVDAVKEEQQQ